MEDKMIKRVNLSQIKEDLNNGMTKWKKDDIGFGSLEKKYNLTQSEMIKLLAHPKVEKMETKIPTFIIEDDLQEQDKDGEVGKIFASEPIMETKQQIKQETKIEVSSNQKPVKTTNIQIEEKEESLVAFI